MKAKRKPRSNRVATDAGLAATHTTSVFLNNIHYFFAQTDGTYKYPSGSVGDLLKQAKLEIEAANVVLSGAATEVKPKRDV